MFAGFRVHAGYLFVALAGACGGSNQPAASSAAASTPEHAPARHAAADDESETAVAPAPPRAACDDGTCTPCGDAVCPNGWYCDESAPGGAACGWVPECAQKASCACVKKALGACACEEHAGAAHLTCG